MKTNKLILVLSFALISLNSIAQSSTKPKKTGDEWHAAGEAIPRSQAFAASLTKELNLDEANNKKVFQAYLANTKTVDEIKMGQVEEEKKHALKANEDVFNETLKGILTKEQFTKYLAKIK